MDCILWLFKFLSMYLQTQETVTKEASCCPTEWGHYSICVQKFTYMNILIFLFFNGFFELFFSTVGCSPEAFKTSFVCE